ncbi:hypothetical protein [Actinomadura rugatobispora]|uniref:Uncharacterized protein n=1 Tax=Actinomadura rugatobispora TaxID=1994 RepID=A0ABW1AH04_9ACTN|nr:hypothetical protein GCM10010200_046820 [Actinomadura rugatobispora]
MSTPPPGERIHLDVKKLGHIPERGDQRVRVTSRDGPRAQFGSAAVCWAPDISAR